MAEMTRRTVLAGTAAAGGGSGDRARSQQGKRAYRRIATEEGFISPGVLAQNAKTQICG